MISCLFALLDMYHLEIDPSVAALSDRLPKLRVKLDSSAISLEKSLSGQSISFVTETGDWYSSIVLFLRVVNLDYDILRGVTIFTLN